MIDNLAIGLTHLMLLIGFWRLLKRADLDRESPAEEAPVAAPTAGGVPKLDLAQLNQGGRHRV
jgi:hypothetical protein